MTPSASDFSPGGATVALTLDQLPDRQWARVRDVARPGDAEGRQRVLRLTEIGFVPRQPVCVMARGALGGDPLAVRVGRTTFALRRHEAALVYVAPGNGSDHAPEPGHARAAEEVDRV